MPRTTTPARTSQRPREVPRTQNENVSEQLLRIADALSRSLRPLHFGRPVTHVYNPLAYARAAYRAYAQRYARSTCDVLLVGMNPGPWGMAQTGIPFGEVGAVREWLRINARIGKPPREHPRRPVLGLSCPRREVSGLRLWGWARQRFGSPQRFFRRFFVANYCPLCFLESSGRNRTPDQLPVREREALLDACDRALRETTECLRPSWVIGVGAFAEYRARRALHGRNLRIGRILHPSPASPTANAGWVDRIEAQFRSYGIPLPQPREVP